MCHSICAANLNLGGEIKHDNNSFETTIRTYTCTLKSDNN